MKYFYRNSNKDTIPKMEEWTKVNQRTFIIILLIQGITLAFFYYDSEIISFPLLKNFLLFINLFFIPGFLILKLIRFQASDYIDTFLFTFGTSISFLIILTLIISTILHIIIPFSLTAQNFLIFYEICILILILSIFFLENFNKNQYFKKSNQNIFFLSYPELKQKLKNLLPYCLLSWVMIILSIFASKTGAFSDNTQLYIALDLLITITILFFGIKKSCTPIQYAIIIFGISLSLLFQHSLLSDFVVGMDIQSELSYTINIVQNGFWDISINSQVNSSAGSLLLASLFSILFKVNLQWTFKIIFPLILAFVPVILFQIYRDIFKEKIAFLSVIFFISFFSFYDLMISLPRQILAELFLCLILLLIIKYKNKYVLSLFILILLYSITMILSHYVLAFMFSIIFPIMFLLIRVFPFFNNFWKTSLIKNKHFPNTDFFSSLNINKENFRFTPIFVIFCNYPDLFFFISATSPVR